MAQDGCSGGGGVALSPDRRDGDVSYGERVIGGVHVPYSMDLSYLDLGSLLFFFDEYYLLT